MECSNCPFYESSPLWNCCNLTSGEYFYTIDNCVLVNDDGTVNQKEYEAIFGKSVV